MMKRLKNTVAERKLVLLTCKSLEVAWLLVALPHKAIQVLKVLYLRFLCSHGLHLILMRKETRKECHPEAILAIHTHVLDQIVTWPNLAAELTGICTHWLNLKSVQFSSVQSLSHVQLFATPWIAARQASLSITNPQTLLIESVMPSSHLILCGPLLLLPPIPPSSRVFSNESTLCIRWPKYWSFSFSISPSNEHP